jgi:hypothetical protein
MPANAAPAVAGTPASTEKPIARRTLWRNQSTVTMTEKGATNPKKAGSASFDRYQAYLGFGKRVAAGSKNPPTVTELFAAGVRMDDLRHDVAHGFINLVQPFDLRENA